MPSYLTVPCFVAVALASVALPACDGSEPPTGPEPVEEPQGPGEEPDTTPSSPPPSPSPQPHLELAYATYVGGSRWEEAREPVLLPGGRLLFGVRTYSSNMPTTAGAIQASFGGGDGDTWLGVLSADGAALDAATYLGGSGPERPPYGMAVTSDGDVVVTSGTDSRDFPVTPGAYRSALDSPVAGGYVCRLSADLSTRRWCTYITGWPRGGLAVDAQDNVIVGGRALPGAPFSPTAGAFQTRPSGHDDAFLVKLAANGSRALFRTLLGGSGSERGEVITSVKALPDRLVVGGISQSADFPTTPDAVQRTSNGARDAFVAWLEPDGSSLLYSTQLGGSGQDLAEHSDALLPDGSVVIGGETFSRDLPGASGTLRGERDGFVARLSPSGAGFDFVRYIGGGGGDRVIDRSADSKGRIILVGETSSRDFQVTDDAFQPEYGGGESDGFFIILETDGTLVYATYLGGGGTDLIRGVAIGPADEAYLVGLTTSNDFPVTDGAFQTTRGGAEDAFVVKLEYRE